MYLDIFVTGYILLCWQKVEFIPLIYWCSQLHPRFKVTPVIGNGIIHSFLYWFHRNVYLSVVSIEMTLKTISSNDPDKQRRTHLKKLGSENRHLWYTVFKFLF